MPQQHLIFKLDVQKESGAMSIVPQNPDYIKKIFPNIDMDYLKMTIDFAEAMGPKGGPAGTWMVASIGTRSTSAESNPGGKKVVKKSKKGTPVAEEATAGGQGVGPDVVTEKDAEETIPVMGSEIINDEDFALVDANHIHISKFKTIFFGSMIYCKPGSENNPSQEQLEFMFNQMLEISEDSEIVKTQIRNLCKSFNAYGYTLDAENLINPPLPEDPAELEKLMSKMPLIEFIKKRYPVPNSSKTGFHIEQDVWNLLVRNVMRGENTLLIGPTGAGKTEIVAILAEVMGKNMFIQDMGTVQDAQSALLGVHRLNKDGHSEFDFAPFVGHVQEENSIVLLDELSRK